MSAMLLLLMNSRIIITLYHRPAIRAKGYSYIELCTHCMPIMTYWFISPQSIVSYARSVFLQSNKKIFDVNKLPLDEFAQ